MSSFDRRQIPLTALVAAGLVMITTLLGVKLHVARHPLASQTASETAVPLQSRQLQFIDQGDGVSVYGGHVSVYDGETGAALPQLRENDGFIRAVLNALAFERKKRGVDGPPLFQLDLWPDRRLTVTDRVSGVRVNVGQFGEANKAVFLRLLPGAGTPR